MSTTKSLPSTPTEMDLSHEASPPVMEKSAAEDKKGHSTLEVYHEPPSEFNRKPFFIESDEHAAPMFRPSSADGKMAASYDHDSHKEAMAYETEVPYPVSNGPSETQAPRSHHPKILGLRRKTFLWLIAALLIIIIGAAVGGGVGGATASRNSRHTATSGSPSGPGNATATAIYTNTGLAAMQWTDQNGTLHKRIYYQDSDDKVRESAWDNTTDVNTPWDINVISDNVKPGTPIGAVAGWPHASYNYSLVKNVYYMSPGGELVERQAQANDSQAWEDDNFTGLFSGSNGTYLAAYWGQNIYNTSEELVVLFQRDNFANGLTQARYISANLTSEPWVSNNFPFAQPKGANFAMSLVSYRSGKHQMLYTIGDDNKVGQYEYSINDNEPVDSTSVVSVTSQSTTPLTVAPQAPLAVVAQDNQPLYTDYNLTLPECYQETPLTNLIMFTTLDRSSLVMNAWNCTAGFQDHTSEIEPLQKANTTFLALAAMSDRATGDGNVYLMFDNGTGPQLEEWTVPRRAGDPWVVSQKVDADFAF